MQATPLPIDFTYEFMDMKFSKIITFAIVLSTIGVTHAEWMDESTVKTAAEAFTLNDAIGATILKGCTVAGLTQRQNLWIVSLEPSGHIVMSGSDLADPIVGFSTNDFAEPDPDSPAYAYLAGISASLAAQESNGGMRHARWNRLLGGGTRLKLMAADIESPATVVIPPFLQSHYNQWQPYNDYAPVYESCTNDLDSYRGRCPCGCVATAAAQGFRHFRWPARMDRVESFNHSFTDTNNVETSFPIRFNGHLPIDWSSLEDDYVSYVSHCVTNYYPGGYSWWWESDYDLRGTVQESVRYPVARLIMFADVLARMSFESGGSSANYGTAAGNAADWYTSGTWVSASDARVSADIANGVPVQVTIPGHAVVGHGWATDGGNTYIYLNYGWGGSNDGYYNIAGKINEVYVGHYPRAKPQIDPLPTVSGANFTLNWHFPDFYTNRLSGFTVSLKKTATETSTYAENFSASSGVATGDEGIFKVGTHSKGYDGNLLYCVSAYDDGQYAIVNSAYYTFPEVYTLTSASVLTLKLRSCYALSNDFEVQARFNGGGWTTIMSPSLSEGSGDSRWGTERLYLGNHGGETIQLRFYKAYTGGSCYTGQDCIFVDDVVLTDVLVQGAETTQNVPASARSYTYSALDAGSTCAFTVAPIMSGALVQAETSEPMTTSIAGERRTPVPGAQTYSSQNLVFSTTDTSGTWSYSGTMLSSTSIRDVWNNSITADIPGEITVSSELIFSWKAKGFYTDAYDTFSVIFKCNDGMNYPLWSIQNTANKTSEQPVSVPLVDYAGKSGKIVISYSHNGSQYTSDGNGGTLSNAQVTNVLVPSVPAVAWNTETLTALGTPEIRLVSSVSEGFYSECGLGTTTFSVTCSENVTSLEAFPSHLALVSDEDVSVTPEGNGRFSVSVRPSGVTEDNARSRMILTLAATDTNGTTTYKDLSLRFAPMDAVAVTVNATTSSGIAFAVDIPYEWVEANGLVPAGSAASAYEAALAANADADSDGIPNWAEYVCGTIPTDSNSKLITTIRIADDGTPIVGYETDGQIANGFNAVIKGTNNLSDDFSKWEVTTGTKDLHFYRVEIIPESE